MRKRNKRLQLIRGYCKDLKRKRYARTYKRYSKTRDNFMDTNRQARVFLDEELKDKGLSKKKLYPGQPKAYVTNQIITINRKHNNMSLSRFNF